jgi:hypothetical protein
MMKNPEDRREAARKYIELVGGKLHGFWYVFGDSGCAWPCADRRPETSRAACPLPATASYLAKSERSALRVPRFARTIAACRFAERLEQLLKAVECSLYLSICTNR